MLRRIHFFGRGRTGLATGIAVAAMAFVSLFWCVDRARRRIRRPSEPVLGSDKILVTGYCNCGKCCGWRRSWFGFGPPVYDYGPQKGKPKAVGVTYSGTRAHHGTIAADLSVYPIGTKLVVPGYGEGVVEDVGGAIKGRHIDIWFPSHREARRWGAQRLDVIRKGESKGK